MGIYIIIFVNTDIITVGVILQIRDVLQDIYISVNPIHVFRRVNRKIIGHVQGIINSG